MESRSPQTTLHPEVEHPVRPGGRHTSRLLVEDVLDWLEDEYDSRYSGFGHESKSLDAFPLLLLLWSGIWGFENRSSFAISTLRTAYVSGIRDRIEDGFFHYAEKRDWSSPHREKLLSDNSWLVQCFLVANAVSGLSEFATAAWETAGYMDTVLWLPDRSFYGSVQEADDDYYVDDVEARRRRSAPPVDRTVYCNWNALAAWSKLLLAWQTGDSRHGDRALQVVDGLMKNMIDSRGACNHYWAEGQKPQITGHLSDYALASIALGEAYQYTQNPTYLESMISVLRFCDENLRVEDGTFHDITHSDERPPDAAPTNLRTQYNALLAAGFMVASGLTEDTSYAGTAAAILEGLGTPAPANNPAIALATGMLLRPVSVVCESRDSELGAWAKTRFLPGLVIRYSEEAGGEATVCTGGRCLKPASSRAHLSEQLGKVYSLRESVDYLVEYQEAGAPVHRPGFPAEAEHPPH